MKRARVFASILSLLGIVCTSFAQTGSIAEPQILWKFDTHG